MNKLKTAAVIGFSFFFVSCFTETVVGNRVIQIEQGEERVDGIALGIQPGDTVFVMAGSRDALILENITGTEKRPVVITNKGGRVVIHTKKDFGILVNNSVHFKITGTGSSDLYGFEIASTANHGLLVTDFSSFCEADHLEIHHVEYAGIVAKTDPNCLRRDLRFFIMQNLSFHDNYIHDITAEGFYVGYSWYPAREFACDRDSLLYPHEIHGIRIFNNTMRNTGQEGIQVGTGTRDVKIYGNSIINYGTTNTMWQNHGVQIGQGTTGELFENYISGGPAEGISLFGRGNNRLYKNVIINCGAAAIYQNDRGAAAGTRYEITDNTILFPGEMGIQLVSNHTKGNRASGNTILISKKESAVVSSGKMSWDTTGNSLFSSLKESRLDTLVLWKEIAATNAVYPFEMDSGFTLLREPEALSGGYFFKTIADPDKTLLKLFDGAGIVLDSNLFLHRPDGVEVDLSGKSTGVYYLSETSALVPPRLHRLVVR